MSRMDDFDKLVNNCKTYSTHSKYREILNRADGKTHYTDIAKELGMHETQISTALRLAEKLGLATKNIKGFYKKKAGVMSHIPKNSSKRKVVSTGTDVVKKITLSRGKKMEKPSGATVSNRISNSANMMSSAYNHLYFTENTLRELIRKVFTPVPNWWNAAVPVDIRGNVATAISTAPYHATARHDELEYTHLGDLAKIIEKNWTLFQPHIKEKNKAKFTALVSHAIPSRNAIGHCIPLTSEDSKWVKMRFEDVLKMIN